MQVNRAATMQIESVPADAPVSRAAEIMKEANIGLLLVADGNKMVGVITDRDIVTRAVAGPVSVCQTQVRHIMSNPVVCIHGDSDIQDAATLMSRGRVRRLVVTNDNNEPVGVLSLHDLAFFTHGDETAGQVLEELAHGPQAAAQFRPL